MEPVEVRKANFIKKATLLHNGKYDYSKVDYVKNSNKVIIICPIHGEFLQTPADHLDGCGCQECGKEQRSQKRRKTTEDFIKRAKEKHGDRYDYSKTVYTGNKNALTIICPKHGEFLQLPSNHLKGEGCIKCAHEGLTKRQDDFIVEMIDKYGDKYDLSKVEYKTNDKKVEIICKEHGTFWQYPTRLLNGFACPYCSGYKLNNEMFLIKLKSVFQDKYDTSKVNYKRNGDKVCMVCHEKDRLGHEHGEFWASPANLLKGYGCPKCAKVYQRSNDEFIELANHIHNGKYDYSKANFTRVIDKVEIICHEKDENGIEHGPFFQTPNIHLSGSGCPKCGEKRKGTVPVSEAEFIERARKVHGDKYDYLEFNGLGGKAKIYCNKKNKNGIVHGEFWQLPNNHLRGRGCPKCRSSHLEEKVLLFLESHKINYIKEKTFEWLKKHNYLPLDFYLEDFNIAIECQGKHHFRPVNFGGKMSIEKQEELLAIQKKNDEFKKSQCESHGVRMVYINYDDDVENVLRENLRGVIKPIQYEFQF